MPARRSNTWRASLLAFGALLGGTCGERLVVGDRAPQPRRHGVLFDLLQRLRHAGLAEILLREDVGGDLAPMLGHAEVGAAEHDGAVGVLDLGRRLTERDRVVGRFAGLGEATCDLHWILCPAVLKASRVGQLCKRGTNRRRRPDPGWVLGSGRRRSHGGVAHVAVHGNEFRVTDIVMMEGQRRT